MWEQQDNALKSLNSILKLIAGPQIKKIRAKTDRLYEMSDEEAKQIPFIGKYTMLYYLKEWGEKPAANYLKDLTKPIFVTQGEKDVHVSVENDFNMYKEILGDRPNVTYKLYPGLNHLFMPAIYGTINKVMKEYKVPQKVEDFVIDDLADWVKEY